MKRVLLIDGTNILYRSYYATAYTGNIMRNSKGFPTNALYGLINMLNKIINEEKPEYVMIAFDKGKTFRHEMYDGYKADRLETPDDFKLQMPIAKKIVEAMGMTYMECDNYEADDIIGTYNKESNLDPEYYATIISSDKDLLQLITDETDVKLLKQEGFIRMDKKAFMDIYGVEPIRMIDLKALMGDSSDNIPGVKGVGEKTAITLLSEYKSLDGIYENIDSVKGKLKEKLIDDKDNAYFSRDLATIYCDVPIDTDFEKIKYRGIDSLRYIEILEELEFYSVIKKLDIKKDDIRENVEKEKLDVKIILKPEDLHIKGDFSIYLEIFGYNYHKDSPIGFGIYDGTHSYYVPFDIVKKYPNILTVPFKKYTYDLKKILVSLSKEKLEITNCDYDLMIAAYLLNYNINDDIAYMMNNMGFDMQFYEIVYGSAAKIAMPTLDIVSELCCLKAKFIYDTRDQILKKIVEEEAEYLFDSIEMPLCKVLADMEITGIKVDKSVLNKMSLELDSKMRELTLDIYRDAGVEFNILSPKQLGEILFVTLGLPYPKRIKDTSYSTSKEILDKIESYHPIVGRISEYRTLAKLQSNYATGLVSEISEDGRIHTIFNQTLTRTGRLSSSSPNLQNIPIRLEYGRLIRKAFIPDDNSILLSSDYSQIELRIFAHISSSENMIEAFKNGLDIHAKTASDIFGVKLEEVTSDQRRAAKAVNFGILYGISSFGLSEGLNIDVGSAKRFIDDYLKTYPSIKEYMDATIKSAHELGYVKTIMNRKRTIEELKNKNYMIRSGGERMALNTPIQGSSADILKKAMIEIFNEFKKCKLKSKMLLQVHDELVFNVLKEEEETVNKIVRDIMENTYNCSVPLKVDINTGNNWYEAK